MSTSDTVTLIGTLTGTLVPIVVSLTLSVGNYIKAHTHDSHLLNFANRISVLESKFGDISPDKIKTAINVAESLDPGIKQTLDNHDNQIQAANNKITELSQELEKLKGLVPKQ